MENGEWGGIRLGWLGQLRHRSGCISCVQGEGQKMPQGYDDARRIGGLAIRVKTRQRDSKRLAVGCRVDKLGGQLGVAYLVVLIKVRVYWLRVDLQ